MDSITKGLSSQPDLMEEPILLYLECITKKLLNMDTSETEAAFNEILKKDFLCKWHFNEIESWLKDADIEEDTKRYIKEKTELLKQKQ